MTTVMLLLNALFSAAICLRLILFRREGGTHRPLASLLAYLLTVSSGAMAIAILLLCLVPLMPDLWLAMTVLLLRFSISQLDVPARQSYTMAVVDPDERSAASGITTVARSVGAAVSPMLGGLLMAQPLLFSAPFFLAGSLKIIYDLVLFKMFKNIEE